MAQSWMGYSKIWVQLKPNSYYLDSGKDEHVKIDHVILAAKTYEWHKQQADEHRYSHKYNQQLAPISNTTRGRKTTWFQHRVIDTGMGQITRSRCLSHLTGMFINWFGPGWTGVLHCVCICDTVRQLVTQWRLQAGTISVNNGSRMRRPFWNILEGAHNLNWDSCCSW